MDGKNSQNKTVGKLIGLSKSSLAISGLTMGLLTGCLPEGKEGADMESKLSTSSMGLTSSPIMVSASHEVEHGNGPGKNQSDSHWTTPTPSPTPILTATPSPSPMPSSTPSPTPSTSSSPTAASTSTTSTIAPAIIASASVNTTAEIMVNNGERYTSSLDVIVSIHKDFIPEMKVTQNGTCDGGVWEANAPTKNIHLNMPNSVNDVSVQFRDFDKNVSECFVTQVVHDNTPPTVSVSGIMTPVTVNVATAVSIQISDSGSGLKSATCTINNVSTSCSTTSLANSVIGTQTLQVIAIDRTGNQTTTSTSWTVQEKQPDLVRHNIATRIQSNTKSDILFVIDNSGSMQYEQQSMANRMSHFIHAIAGLDWRIGITTTDPDHPVWGDGRLVKMKNINDQYVLTNNGPEDRLQEILGKTIQREEVGSGSEQGIRAVYRAIQRSFEIPKGGVRNPNRELFRDDANLSIIVISDENESAHTTMNDPAQLARFMKGQWPQKKINFHSIITRPNDVKCLRSYGASYGVAYWEISHMLNFGEAGGSIIGDVCATDYTSQLVGIGQAVSDLQKVIKLDCEPKGDVNQNITILHNSQNFTEPFTIDGKSLVFQDPLPLGVYELQYYCSQ